MSYFSRVRVLPTKLDDEILQIALAGDAYRDHALVWRLFPGDDQERDFVFRAESRNPPVYYVVSQRPPQPSPALAVETRPYQPQLQVGEWLRFDLRANPTVSIKAEGAKRGKRHDVMMHAKRQHPGEPEQQQAMDAAARKWLQQHAVEWGLALDAETALIVSYQQHDLRPPKSALHPKGRQIQFSTVDYQGCAQVTDPAKLCDALHNGVGHSKAFGCGLLLVKRLR